MAIPQARIANNKQQGQMILESINLVLAKVGHFSRHDRVGKALLQLVHNSPLILNFLTYVFSVQALERTLSRRIIDSSHIQSHSFLKIYFQPFIHKFSLAWKLAKVNQRLS